MAQDRIYIYGSDGTQQAAISQVIDSNFSERLTGELTLSFVTKAERIPEINAETEFEFRGQYYRAVQVQHSVSDGAFLVSVSCEQESIALVDDEIELFDHEGTADGALAALLAGTGITATAEYTGVFRVRLENTNRRAVLTEICGICGAEIEYNGHTIRLVKRRGAGSSDLRNLADLMPWTDFSETADLRDGTVSYEVSGADPDNLILGETVRVVSRRFGISAQKRIVGISYNPFNCTEVQVEVGDYVPDILASYRDTLEENSDTREKAETALEQAGDSVKYGELSAKIGKYISEETGRASIIATLQGTYVEPSALNGYTKKTELSAEIGAYIDTQAGTAKIVNNLTGTFVKPDTLGSYVAKTELSAGIETYIDTSTGKAKLVSAVSGTYVSQSSLTGTLENYAQKGDIPDVSGFLKKTELNAGIETYIDTSTGKAKLVSAVSGTYVSQSSLTGTLENYAKKGDIPDVSGFLAKTELSAEIGAYIDTQAGTAKIVNNLTGTFVKPDALGSYVAKTDLNAGIESYIDTTTGKAKLVSAVSGTYATKSSLSDYVQTTSLSAEIGVYIDTQAGTAKIVNNLTGTFVKPDALGSYVAKTELKAGIETYIDTATGKAKLVAAVSGTYATKSSLSDYVKTTSLSAEIGAYIDTQAGTAKIVSAVSGTYQTISGMSGYAKASAITTIEQSISNINSSITLSATYTNNTIGTNVYALLQLVSNPNSSNIKIQANKIDFTGFTTFLRASDLGSSGSTTIDGGRITTGTISADRIDVSKLKVNTIYGKGTYNSYTAMTTDSTNLYIGGSSFSASYSNIYLAAKTKVYFGSTGVFEICVDMSSDSIYSTYAASYCGTASYPWGEIHGGGTNSYHIVIADTVVRPSANNAYQTNSLGTSSYPWNAIYAKAIYLNGTALSTASNPDLAGSLVKMGGSTSYYIQATTSRELCPSSSSTTYPCYLGTSSLYWHYAYIGSNTASIGNSGSSKIGFFGTTPAARQTVANTATVATLITALKKYGLIA